MGRRRSHDAECATAAVAGTIATRRRRTSILLDLPTRRLLRGPTLVMLRHCLPQSSSLRAANVHLIVDQETRICGLKTPGGTRHGGRIAAQDDHGERSYRRPRHQYEKCPAPAA